MQYSFDVQEAVDYGDREAIIIYNIRFWIIKNKANEKHFYDGRTWTYNKTEAFRKLFPFWTYDQIRRLLDKLVKNKILLKGNYNQSQYDRTSWYAFVDENKFLSSALIIKHLADLPNGNGNNAKSNSGYLPNGNGNNAKYKETDIKPDIKPYSFSDEKQKKEIKALDKNWKKTISLDVVKTHFKDKGYNSNAERFFNTQSMRGWKGIENWFYAAANWELNFNDGKSVVKDNKVVKMSEKQERGLKAANAISEYCKKNHLNPYSLTKEERDLIINNNT